MSSSKDAIPRHAIKLAADQAFPKAAISGHPVTIDYGGQEMFLGLVPIDGGLHPCKVVKQFQAAFTPHVQPPARYGYAGAENEWFEDYYLVPFDGSRMEWVSTSHGRPPPGKRPVEGGREADGSPLYHAIGEVDGVRTLGKVSVNLGGALFPFGGCEVMNEYYEVLCWR
ncbi:hypothetical protein BKA62DRAFT_639283 [Auriculariales sp. MPI-PUGE-AT-0066]|nr:hypothetical protein BKA62DRAFT_639283 [Auriculariales sp. MPI-PUGE-AT-0066]